MSDESRWGVVLVCVAFYCLWIWQWPRIMRGIIRLERWVSRD